MYRIHPALPGYLAAGWHAEDPAGYDPGAGGVRAGAVHRLRRLQPVADRADRIRGRRPRLRRHRAAAADPGRDARPRPGPPRVGRRRAVLSGRWMRTGTPAASARKPPPGPTASWTPPPAPARTPSRDTRPLAVAVHHHPAGHQAEGRRAAGPGRANLPARPRLPAGPARNRLDPWQHRRHLPPARHDRPGPRAAGRGRGLVPQIPHHQRRTRRPPRHGEPPTTSSASPPSAAGGWTRPRTGTAKPSPSKKNSATAPAWRSPTTSSA